MDIDPHVKILSGLDHAHYDATLIKTWRPDFQWVESQIQGDAPFKPQHFIMDARSRIAASLSGREDMKGQKFGEERTALTYIAFETVFQSMQWVHLRQFPLDRMSMRLRKDFQDCLKKGAMVTAHEFSPLWGKGQREVQGNGIPAHMQPITSTWDKKLFQTLSETPQATQSFIEQSVPFLASIDRGMINVYEEDFRKKIWALLEGQEFFYDELRAKMRDVTLETWLERYADTIHDELRKIGSTMGNDLEESLKLEEIHTLDAAQVRARLKAAGIKPRGSAEENMLLLTQHEVAGKDKDLPLTEEDEETVEAVMECMKTLISRPDAETDKVKNLIRSRLPALEYFILMAAQDGEVELLMDMQQILRPIEKLLNLKHGSHPALGFLNFAMASHCSHVGEGRQELTPKLLLQTI